MLTNKYFNFFTALDKNNNREWFAAHKNEFELVVKTPFIALVDSVIQEMRLLDPELDTTAKESIFRIYRDVRFSKNKSPYKTHMAAYISREGKKDTWPRGLYLEVNTSGGVVAGGVYQPTTEHLTLVRDLIMHEGKSLHKLMEAKLFKEHYPNGLVGEKNKVLPAEFKEAAKSEPLLYNKQLLWWATVPASVFTDPKASATIGNYYRAAKPISDFLSQVYE